MSVTADAPGTCAGSFYTCGAEGMLLAQLCLSCLPTQSSQQQEEGWRGSVPVHELGTLSGLDRSSLRREGSC